MANNIHFPQANNIAGGPSEYEGDEAREDRTYGYNTHRVIINPNDVGGSVRDGRNFLFNRQTNSGPITGSFLIPRSTIAR